LPYPDVLGERETLELCFNRSIARYGDGEFKLAIGRKCVSQVYDPKLGQELRAILETKSAALPAIPNGKKSPRAESWAKYAEPPYAFRFADQVYGSAFISRPDSAPWIDTPEYWNRVFDLWRGKDVVLAVGDRRSIREEMLHEAASLRIVNGMRQHTYQIIDRLEEEIGKPSGPVLMCLGATATVLAERLAKKGVHALDLGHIGMFWRHAGIYRYALDDLTSPGYRAQLQQLRARVPGAGTAQSTPPRSAYIEELQPETILDYGCGEMKLAEALAPRRVMGYDPGIPGRESMPKPVDLVVSTDVLEHVEPKKIDAVLDHIFRLAGKGAYLVIATRPAKAVLPDGSNAHKIVEPAAWWVAKLQEQGWKGPDRIVDVPGREVRLWLRK
jgi:2-polyprenyl-3-methyl-5-hydroxy-6-metoxy-1,4-benzoquinol methylase